MGDRRVRSPAVAGTFYPAAAETLRSAVEHYLRDAGAADLAVAPRGLIVPHAGYRYSGSVAASAYAALGPAAVAITRVVLAGPAHFVPLRGLAISGATAWRTPLGDVAIDADLARRAAAAGAIVDDAPHAREHALEVQLPFLQVVLGPHAAVLLPVAVGVAEAARVADFIETLMGPGTLLVVSTDLSHYHDDATAKRLDRRTAEAITARAPDAIDVDGACGVFALRGAVESARRADLPVRLLDLRTSADTAGDPSRVVGYGAFAIGAA